MYTAPGRPSLSSTRSRSTPTGQEANQELQAPSKDQRSLEETKGYLKCNKCGTSIHKRVNEKAFNEYILSPCLDCPFPGQHNGHPSHQLWQKGAKISCTLCGLQLHLDSQQRVISATAFLKECKGAGVKGSPPIHSFFKPTAQTNEQSAWPTPKRLHFSTQLTECEDELNPAQAMKPSLSAGPRHSQHKRAETPEPVPPAQAMTPRIPAGPM